ncbi:hypothetical protein [Acinetobacter pragensis]|nr:hypothetical protein [Acinetobacter pragensis]
MNNNKFLNFFSRNYFFLIFYLIFIDLSLFLILSNALSNVRFDIFLISDLEEGYQRAGDFLVILYFISTIIVFFILEKNQKISINIFIILLYLLMLILVGSIAQIIGSNKGLVIPILIFCCTFYVFFKDLKGSNRAIIKLFFLFFIFLFFIFAFLNLDVSSLRILGYGSGESSSFQSRYEIFVRNFYIHFIHSPYIGDLNVDTLLTGQGTYVHSFLFFSLTHFGLLGFTIIFIYIFSCYRSILGENKNLKLNKIIFLLIFVFSIFSTAVFWPVIWFVIGVLCPAFFVESRFKSI